MYGYHIPDPLDTLVRDENGQSLAKPPAPARKPGVMLADDAEAIAHRMRELKLGGSGSTEQVNALTPSHRVCAPGRRSYMLLPNGVFVDVTSL